LLIAFVVFLDRSVISALQASMASAISGAPVDEEVVRTLEALFVSPSLTGFAVLMLVVNVMLVLFNMIPAFPMDGGRVFRSLMAMVLDYRKATWLASRVGVVCAFLMALVALGIDPTNPIPVLIAVFIGYAGLSEARHVEVMEQVRGLTVGEVMIRSNHAFSMEMPLSEMVRQWRHLPVTAMPVVSVVGTVVGMIRLSEVVEAMERKEDLATMVGQLVDHQASVGTVRAAESLESVLMRLGKKQRQVPVLDEAGLLVGVLDLDTMLIRRGLFSPQDHRLLEDNFSRFDQIT
jgi:hypothetical protein